MTKELVYFADPMCSWCWGFASVTGRIVEHFGARAPLRVMLGGLQIGTTTPLDDAAKAEIRSHWEHVRDATGQPFDFSFFDRDEFTYDTEPACRAVVTMRRIAPDRTLRFLDSVHRAFYARNEDVTEPATLFALAASFGLSARDFAARFEAAETIAETRQDFVTTRRVGVSGYPTLVGAEQGQTVGLAIGYQPWETVERVIGHWLEQPEHALSDAAAS